MIEVLKHQIEIEQNAIKIAVTYLPFDRAVRVFSGSLGIFSGA